MTDTPNQPELETDALLAAAWEQGSGRPKSYDTSKLWERVAADTVNSEQASPASARRRPMGRYLGIAAAVLGVIAGVNYIPALQTLVSMHAPSPSHTYTTLRGERANITLSDGTIVSLAPDTRLSFTSNKSERAVQLTGQAVFNVTQRANAPFTVNANGTVTRVLGTLFSVRAYDKNVRVAVKDGKVAVRDDVISAGYVANISSGNTVVSHNPSITDLDCSTSSLTLDRVAFASAIADIERWYDIEIKVKDNTLLNRTVTASFDGTSLPNVISTLSSVLEARVEQNGHTLIFRSR